VYFNWNFLCVRDFFLGLCVVLSLFVLVFHLSISPLYATAVMWLLISLMTE
jgi:hypothetical protein